MNNAVRVRLTGILRGIAGREELALKLENSTSLADLIFRVAELFSEDFRRALIDVELGSPKPNALIVLNGREISALPDGLKSKVKNGDEVVIIPVTHGG